MPDTRQDPDSHPLERWLVLLGAGACMVITIALWRGISAYQGMWPLPALYFIEMAVLGVVSALAFMRGGAPGKIFTWASVGIFAAFSLLGAFSVGFAYVPITLIFAVASVAYDARNRQRILVHLGVCFIAGLAQAALMLGVVRLLYLPAPLF